MNKDRSIAIEPIIAAANELISAVPFFGAFISATIAAGMVAYQNKNFNKFTIYVKNKFNSIEESKIDYDFLGTDQYKDILLQTLEAALKTSSEAKCNALANALLFSTTLSTSKHIGKQTFIRVISQMFDEEILILQILYEVEKLFEVDQKKEPMISLQEIADKLGWNLLDVKVTFGGLVQLGLAYDPTVGTWSHMAAGINEPKSCRISSLGLRCIQYALATESKN